MSICEPTGQARDAIRRAALWIGVAVAATAGTSQAQSIEDALESIAREARDEQSPSREGAPEPATTRLEQALLDAGGRLAADLSISELSAGMPKRLGGGKVSGRLLRLVEHRARKRWAGWTPKQRAWACRFTTALPMCASLPRRNRTLPPWCAKWNSAAAR